MRYFRVRKHEHFQHYKDRNPPWIKLHQSCLASYRFLSLSDTHRWHALSLALLASRYDNHLPADPKFLQAETHSRSKFALDILEASGFIVWCQCTDCGGDENIESQEKWPSRYISDATRLEILDRDGNKCRECGSASRLEIDHIIPVSRMGQSVPENLQVLCRSCNRSKRNRMRTAEQVATQEKSLRSLESEQRESRVREEKNKSSLSDFDAFYTAYPRKRGKADALRAWAKKRANGMPEVEKLITAIEAQKQGQWDRIDAKFIPYPATWLRGERWNDEIEPTRSEPKHLTHLKEKTEKARREGIA